MPIGKVKTKISCRFIGLGHRGLISIALLTSRAFGQTPTNSSHPGSSSSIDQGIDLAEKGRCEEALPLLKKFTPPVTDKPLKYRALMATVRCALNRRENQAAANTLFDFEREFPEDPEVLYMTSEFFLEIAVRASQQLATIAPTAYQTRELQAETLESQNKWGEAAAIYNKILEENPKVRGIHFRMGRAALSQPESPTSLEDAKKEFEQELAGKLDSSYAETFLALGMTLNSAGRFSEAITQLQHFVKMSPEDPAGHYQLSIAYARTGRDQDFGRETALHKQLLEKKHAAANTQTHAAPH